KSKKAKVVQMLSPENYIRKKARTLPIYECLVSSEWEEVKMCTVVIAREHVNGSITFCTYVVDLGCLGVKDSMFQFNVSVIQYRDILEKLGTEMEMVNIDYALAHNIVLAGVEYAAEFGFKPCKEYESITKFMLEEDTDEIELIEIECGKEGKPFYVQGPFEDMSRANWIIAQLERTAGPGNYNYILKVGDEFMDDYEDDELDDEYEFDDWTYEEKEELFLTLSENIDDLEEDEVKRLFNLTDSMVEDLVDVNEVDQFYDQYMDELDVEIDEDKVPVQLLGLRPGDQPVSKELINKFMDIYQLSGENPKLAAKELKLFHKESNAIPGSYLLELLILQTEHPNKYAKRLKEYAQAFPDYALIQLLWATSQVTLLKDQQKRSDDSFKMESFFPDRESIHPIEMLYTLIYYSFATGVDLDINKIEAFGSVLYDLGLPETYGQILETTNSMFKFTYLLKKVKE
ncbi:MAG TPA: hypothetical protein DCL77_03560, partial [Prolixibacteraceae bacterium]|nr:hypothetical protein [Prolixibacteraceae bacterium]